METVECGAACLAMILASYGRHVPLEMLRVECGVSRDGVKAANILRAARAYGLLAQGFRYQSSRLLDHPFPMIAFWRRNHFVVLEGIRGNSFYINDPAEGPRKVSRREFDESYSGICLVFEPAPQFRRGGAAPSTFKSLLDRLGRARTALFYVVVATLLLVIPGLAVPTFSKVFVDEVLVRSSDDLVLPLLLGLGAAAVLQGVLTWLQQISIARMETKLALVTTARFFWHVVALPMTFFAQRFAGDVANRVASNDTVARLLSGEFATHGVNALTAVIYGAVLLSYDVPLTLVAFGMIAVNLIALLLVARARDIGNRRILRENGRIAGLTVNGLQMIETLKSSSRENELFSRLTGMHTNSLIAQQELGLMTNLLVVVPPLLSGLTTIAILGIGGLRILDGALTIGGLVAFQILARNFSQPIEGLVLFGAQLQTVRGEIARLDDVLNYPRDDRMVRESAEEGAEPAPYIHGFVEIENVSFGYNRREPPQIVDFSLSLRPGQRVALVGGSGSGKSTIAKLICGLLEPQSGTIRVDDIPLSGISAHHLARAVSYVDQNIVLFDGSVRDNVALWNPVVRDRDVTQALRDAEIYDEVMARPEKYDTPVGEGGCNLSGGQRQRMEIARALVTSPPILVLDEATAVLDAVTELKIDDNLRRRRCTTVIVAHRLSTIRDADEIIVLREGRIVQRGTHDSLIGEDGLYRTLITAN